VAVTRTARSPALARLTEAVSVLADESLVLELAVRALYEVCPRGVAIGFTSVGADSVRAGAARMVHEGALVEIVLPHLAYVRTPAYDVTQVPLAQRTAGWSRSARASRPTKAGGRAPSIPT
jgi:hypothetical protein